MGGEPPPGAAPVQSFGQDEPMGAEEELEPEAGEALPPGSICPACGSDDVDVKSGDFNCNGCGAEGTISVKIEVVTWPDSIEEKSPDKGDQGEDMGAEAAPGGAGGIPMPEVGLAASFKVTPEMVKLAGNKPVGSFCPHCGSDKVKLTAAKDHHVGKCVKCDGAYRIDAYVNTSNPKELVARIAWKDRNVAKAAKARVEAANIKAKKAKLVSALKQAKLEEKFAKADVAGKAHIIAKLADQGLIGK
jgi:ribosomal protein L37AE/L43A